MGIPAHTAEQIDGSSFSDQSKVKVGLQTGVANAAGGGAGQSVTTAVSFANLPANYAVVVSPGQDATWYITSKTASGFNVVLTPRLAANTLASGTFDLIVLA